MKNVYMFIALLAISFPGAAQQPNDSQRSAEPSPGMQQMQGRMQDMRGLMERIHNTKDPQERDRLMHEHMQSMQQAMSMMGQMMRGQGDASAEARPCGQGDTACQMQRMQEQQQMMNQRMNMMQMMMEQMMGQMTQRDAEVSPPQPSEQNHEAHH